MNSPIKVLIVEDQAIFREGLKKVLGEIRDVEVIGEAENGQVFLDLMKKLTPDIVLMDIKMPVMDGTEATEKALKLYPDLKIIILSMFGEEEYLYAMVLKGVYGFLLKTISVKNLEQGIHTVYSGHQYFCPELNGILAKKLRQVSTNDLPSFTTKENEVLQFICKGLSTEEIANELCLSKRTVEGFRAKLLQKTELNNTIKLVLWAVKNKLVVLDEIKSNN